MAYFYTTSDPYHTLQPMLQVDDFHNVIYTYFYSYQTFIEYLPDAKHFLKHCWCRDEYNRLLALEELIA